MFAQRYPTPAQAVRNARQEFLRVTEREILYSTAARNIRSVIFQAGICPFLKDVRAAVKCFTTESQRRW